MPFNKSLACSLQKRVGKLWKRDEFSDFTVVVENTSFKCHRFILSACSGFFQGLLNSQMKEQIESCATLVGMTANTFEIVINALYTGTDGLSKDNVLDVWSATELLEIDYLIERCHSFVWEHISVENCFRFLDHAVLYAAQKAVDHSLEFIVSHFDQVIKRDSLFHLSFDHFYKIVTNDNLAVRSEDKVLDAILKWVEYNPRCEQKTSEENGNATEDVNDTDDEQSDHDSSTNSLSNSGNLENVRDDKKPQTNGIITGETNNYPQSMDTRRKADTPVVVAVERNNVGNDESNIENRKQHLLQLLSACRLFTIKSGYLDSEIQNHTNLFVDTGTDTLMQAALIYTLNASLRHDTWPEAAVHRAYSSSKHVIVFVCNDKIMACYLSRGRVIQFVKLPESIFPKSSNITITIFNNILYLLVDNVHGCQVKQFYMLSKERTFVLVNSIEQEHEIMLLPHGNYIYYSCLYNDDYDYKDIDCELYRISCVPELDSVWSKCGKLDHFGNCLVRFHDYVLVFLTRNDAITAQCYNTETQHTHNCETSMEGTSQDMTSFRHKEDVYLIQRNGSLWKVFSTDETPVDFELVSKLWDFDCSLKGCVLYREKLFIFCDNEPSTPTLTKLPDIFANLEIIFMYNERPGLPLVLG